MATKKSASKRPESSRSSRAKTPAISPNRHGEVVKENNQLKKNIEALKAENESLRKKLETVAERLICNVDESEYNLEPCANYQDISTEDLLAMISDITSQKDLEQAEHYLESRIEEVETRITQISSEFAKLVQLKLRTENSLYEMSRCQTMEEIQEKVQSMLYFSVSTEIFINPQTEVGKKHKNKHKTQINTPTKFILEEPLSTSRTGSNGLPLSVSCNLELVDLPQICGKLPGETHIKFLIPQIKQLIIQELSLYKGNGADWRMFAERVGIPDHLIDQWKFMKLHQPMKNVLNAWSDSPGATVRLIHRHLVSPQMKCILLAKKISNYYIVD